MFSFLRSSVEARRGVEFRHSTRNALKIRRKWSVLLLGYLCLPFCVRDTATDFIFDFVGRENLVSRHYVAQSPPPSKVQCVASTTNRTHNMTLLQHTLTHRHWRPQYIIYLNLTKIYSNK